jgi:catechol 2,3-dioxygenase-like lactoylglutathione lyase family enzyme
MLGDNPIGPVLLATDLQASKHFYTERIGLKLVRENPELLIFKCGGDTQLRISKSTVGTKDDQTQAVFVVKDVKAEVDDLRKRGVKIEDYDLPGVKTNNGIADMGFAWAAWFLDPGNNAVGVVQPKG